MVSIGSNESKGIDEKKKNNRLPCISITVISINATLGTHSTFVSQTFFGTIKNLARFENISDDSPH